MTDQEKIDKLMAEYNRLARVISDISSAMAKDQATLARREATRDPE